jgi:hypothetical protein
VTAKDPLTGSLPLQALLAVQALAFVVDQESVAVCPTVIVRGATERLTLGGALTVSVVDILVEPPGPAQASV